MGNLCNGHTGNITPVIQKPVNPTPVVVPSDPKRDLPPEKPKKADAKILLLGAGETGKSTVMKQLKIFVQGGYTTKELLDYKPLIFDQVINCMKVLLDACEKFVIELQPGNREIGKNFFTGEPIEDPPSSELSKKITPQVWNDLETLWADRGIQKAYLRRSELKLDDSTKYWFENLDRLRVDDYVPNEADILRSRVKSFGVSEFTSVFDGRTVHIIDVGGQKSERKKMVTML